MRTYSVTINASVAGSIGSKYCERRFYEIDASSPDECKLWAIKRAHLEGLEHVLVTSISERV